MSRYPVDDFPAGVAVEPFDDPAANNDRLRPLRQPMHANDVDLLPGPGAAAPKEHSA
ncbi:hypothetical protein [Nocardia sp. SYP-A9097]|uniref:hypothetical protein n=1 Tax=Nocardia sp. SYP-A9097 TaxID=2663237 RepID=UPI00129BCBFA|nr:hypothetical protein [Nocardia sp. SYP-A9097]